MPRTPFYKVINRKSGRDISDLISKFSHELATDQDNLLVLNITQANGDLIDDDDFREGEILSFQYGYIAGKTSAPYLARITDVMAVYADAVHITIRATDLGIVLKKNSSKKVWQNKKSSEIVKEIAIANDLIWYVDDTEKVHKSMPQGGKSDYDFIKYLAALEKDGSYRFFLRNNEVHFTKVRLDQPSFRTLKYNDGDGDVKSFRPYSQESLKKAASRDTVVTSVDPFTNKPVQTVINNSTSKDDVKLGEYSYDFNSNQKDFKNGSKTNTQRPSKLQSAETDTSKAGHHVYTPGDSSEAADVGNKIKKKAAMKDYMTSIALIGDPDYEEDIVITMSGVAKKDSGNWYITRATHSIEPSTSYETRLTGSKNAGKKQIGDNKKQSKINNSTGEEQKDNAIAKKEVSVLYFDKDSNRVFPDARSK